MGRVSRRTPIVSVVNGATAEIALQRSKRILFPQGPRLYTPSKSSGYKIKLEIHCKYGAFTNLKSFPRLDDNWPCIGRRIFRVDKTLPFHTGRSIHPSYRATVPE